MTEPAESSDLADVGEADGKEDTDGLMIVGASKSSSSNKQLPPADNAGEDDDFARREEEGALWMVGTTYLAHVLSRTSTSR